MKMAEEARGLGSGTWDWSSSTFGWPESRGRERVSRGGFWNTGSRQETLPGPGYYVQDCSPFIPFNITSTDRKVYAFTTFLPQTLREKGYQATSRYAPKVSVCGWHTSLLWHCYEFYNCYSSSHFVSRIGRTPSTVRPWLFSWPYMHTTVTIITLLYHKLYQFGIHCLLFLSLMVYAIYVPLH